MRNEELDDLTLVALPEFFEFHSGEDSFHKNNYNVYYIFFLSFVQAIFQKISEIRKKLTNLSSFFEKI
jgi:hypothetical protein